jgi:hypothetical protein
MEIEGGRTQPGTEVPGKVHLNNSESRQGRQNSRHPVARQDFCQVLAESTLLMVFLLVENVIHRGIGLRNAHAEGGISLLPLERPAGLLVNPTR